MMKKLLLGLVAVFCVSSANAQFALTEQTAKSPITSVRSSLVENLFGNKVDKKQAKKQVNVNRNGKHIWADANALGKSDIKALPLKSNAMAKAATTRAGENLHTWWGHITSTSQQLYALGFSTLASEFSLDWMNGQTEYNVACIVPSMYAQAKVDSVQLLLTAAQYKDLKIWVSDVQFIDQDGQQYLDVPESAEEADYSYIVPASDIPTAQSGYVARLTVKLPESFKIGTNGCLVGYSFTGAADDKPIVAAANTSTVDTGSFLWQYEYTDGTRSFEDLSSSQSLNMSLSTVVGLDLSECEANNASVEGSPETTALLNTKTNSNFYVVNNGAKPITSISYVLEVDNESTGEKTQNLTNPIEAGSYSILPYPATFTEEGVHTVNLSVTKVNGNDNIADQMDASNVIVALEKGADRVNVVEQLTATWDGYSPRGIVAFNNLNRDLGDKVITLACHYNYDSSTLDPMNMFNKQDVTDYGYILYVLSSQLGGPSFPGALFNRTAFADSYVGSTQDVNSKGTYDYGATDLVKLLDQYYPSEADMKMTASWSDDTKEGINVDVKTVFNYDRFGEFPYGIGFMLVENGMTGTAGSWRQQNSYNDMLADKDAAYFKNDDMASWFSASSKVRTSYDNVVVDAIEPLGRILISEAENSDVVKGDTLHWNNVVGISSGLIQDKEQLSLVAVLVNLNSYSIVNAARVFLGNKAAGIEDINSEANQAVVSRFNLDGMSINTPQKGINLVKTADGKVKKVVVRK